MRFSMLVVGLAGLVAVACGSDDGGGGGTAGSGNGSSGSGNVSGSGPGSNGAPVDSGAPDGTPANELTDAQVQAFCDSAGKAAEAVVGGDAAQKALCGFSAYYIATFFAESGSGDPAAACQMAYDECLQTPAEPTQEECTKPSPTCTATVAEIEKCLNDSFEQIEEQFSKLPGCDDLGKDVGEPPLESESPASCRVVEEKCPEVLDNRPDPEAMSAG